MCSCAAGIVGGGSVSIEPSHWQRRGESRTPGSRPANLHGWFLSSDGAVDSCGVRKHLDWLLARVGPQADAIHALQKKGCRMDASCFWVSRSAHGGPAVRPAQMRELARLDLELWFDVYLGSGADAEAGAAPDRGDI